MINKILYLKPYFIISAVISLISIIISLFLTLGENFSVDDFILYFILILPTIISALICYIGNRTKIKHPKLTIFFVNVLNILIIIIQCFISLAALIIASWFIEDPEYTNIKDYQKALRQYTYETVKHYPEEIPSEAKNINFINTPGGLLGDSSFYLQFDIDEEYIRKEEEKYKNEGIEYILKDNNNQSNKDFDYNLHRSISALNEVNYKFHDGENNFEFGYKVKILHSGGCISGFATKKNNIIYLTYCD